MALQPPGPVRHRGLRVDALGTPGDSAAASPGAKGSDGDMARTYRLGPARKAVNLITKASIEAGLGRGSYYLLTTTGRKTGRKRTTPVVLVENPGERWLVSPYGVVSWVCNLRALPELSLRRGRRTVNFHALEATPEAAGPVLRQYLRDVRVMAPFFDVQAGDPVERFVAEADRHPVFRLTATRAPG
jgi:deazaflavin-dependent oxidoreductase (nitroreductase family)